jgi:hypothetical protein
MATGFFCTRCGADDLALWEMQPYADHCKSCHSIYDMDRTKVVEPKEAPQAVVVEKKLGGKIGVQCPHESCGHKVLRPANHFHRANQLERCPKCMKHYRVRRRSAK